jgi:hypothetical protein
MSFSDDFNVLKGKALDAAQMAAAKSKELAAIVKAKVNIAAEQDKIKRAQMELGKLYYRDFVAGNDQEAAEYLPWCEKITAAKQTIAEQQAIIDAMKAEGNISDEEEAEITIEVVNNDEEEKTPEEPEE